MSNDGPTLVALPGKREEVTVNWDGERQRLTMQIDEWTDHIEGVHDDDGKELIPRLRSDTAIVQAIRHRQRCQESLDRIAVMEQIVAIGDPIVSCKAKADLASIEGSHGPAQQWTRLMMELTDRRKAEEEAAKRNAEEVGDPTTELILLLRDLVRAPQSVRESMAEIMQQGHVPADWRPPLEVVEGS